jgi:16S rRNA (guanine966-N2)-methyltransferase
VRRAKSNRVRIIAGVWRSRLISFPSVAGLRPSPDRVRETLFNWLGQSLDGLTCLDLFAGSGALGFEALSRGATSVVMVERNPLALKALRENAKVLNAANATIVGGDALEFARGTESRFDLIFVDPPYAMRLQVAALTAIRRLLSEGGRAYVESDEAFSAPPGWSVVKSARAGKVHSCILKREPDDPRSLSGNV